jgi:hypothetical protein
MKSSHLNVERYNYHTPVSKTENTAVVICHADHVAPSIRRSWH